MADEISTTGPADESSLGKPQPATPASAPVSEPEAHIIKETIVRPAPVNSPQPATAPPAPAPAALTEPPKILPASPAGSPVFGGTGPFASPAPPAHNAETFEKEREVISHILEEIKLPERREQPGQPEKSAGSHVFDTELGAKVEGEKPAGPPHVSGNEPATAQEEVPQKQSGIASSLVAPLRTLKNDLQEIVRAKKISLVRAAALESEKRNRSNILGGEIVRAHSNRTFGILFATVLLVVLGGAAFFGVFIIMQERSGIPSENPNPSILFAESTYAFPLKNGSPLDLKRLLAQARGGGGTLGSITRLVPTISKMNAEGTSVEEPTTLEEFLRALGARASPDLYRALSSSFFFGIHTVDENAPLFVIPVLSYERAFAGMLEWEETLNSDLAPAFSAVPDQILGAGGLPEKRRFEDIVMRNYDVRALKDDSGTIQLYYSFPTQHLLVIGESPYSFTEILSRLQAERRL